MKRSAPKTKKTAAPPAMGAPAMGAPGMGFSPEMLMGQGAVPVPPKKRKRRSKK